MKALIIKEPKNYQVEQVKIPNCPDEGMLVKVHACGLCGSDLRTLKHGHRKVQLPWIIGHEIAGEVVETGSKYTGEWKKGEMLSISPLVYCGECEFCEAGEFDLCTGYKEIAQAWHGGFAEYISIPAEAIHRGTIQSIPNGMDPTTATITEPLSSCVNAQEKGNIKEGDTVVIIGAGPIGSLHIELARNKGAKRVIVADVEQARLDLIKDYAPDHVIHSMNNDLVAEVMKITNNLGPEIVITANPAPITQVQAVEMAKKGGKILLFGGLPKDQSKPGIDTNIIHYNALHVIGTTIFAPHHNKKAMQLLTQGRISPDKFITHKLPLSAFAEGVDIAMRGEARKVVFMPQEL